MDKDKTIVRPRPGGAPRAAGELAPNINVDNGDYETIERLAAAQPFADKDAGESIRPRRRGASGPLIFAEAPAVSETLSSIAGDLLELSLQLRHLQDDLDVPQLHRQTVKLVERFRERAASSSANAATVANASYVLCSLIDETVLNTPWGESSLWSQNSLLRLFHQETYGGDRVFRMIDEALGAVRKDSDFLELVYLILSLGFEGKYRIDPRGKLSVEQLRDEIYAVLQASRDRFKKELSPEARAVIGVHRRLRSFLSLWFLAGLLGATAFGVYVWHLIDLNKRSDALQAELAALVPPVLKPEQPVFQARPEVARLRELLASEIERGALRVDDFGTRISVVIQAATMFASASAVIDESFLPILDKIGKSLEIIPGRVVVSGHTDASAIRTARFPSNWHLSLARASEVVKYMSGAAALRGRMLPEGRGDAEPVVSNDTAEGRAKNRRVTIDVYYATESQR